MAVENFEKLRSADDDSLRRRLRELLLEHSIRRGEFTLKSGLTSTWFIDVKGTVCLPDGMSIVALLILRNIPPGVTSIGGQTMGADPIAFGTAGVAAALNRGLRCFSVRKEPKDHGSGGRIAGVLDERDRVIIVEDAATRGTSALAAVEVVRGVGATVAGVFTVVDRGGSARELLSRYGVPFQALLSASDLDLPYEGGLTQRELERFPGVDGLGLQ